MKKDKLIILGAGIAGLVCAHVLCRYFREVIIIDRDELGGESIRRGASQSAHQHVLLKKGQMILFKYFPHLRNQLKARGCIYVDWAEDTIWDNSFGRFPIYKSNIKTLSMSRPLLESLIFKEVVKNKKIKFIKGNIKSVNDDIEINSGEIFKGDLIIGAMGGLNKFNKNLLLKKRIILDLTYRSVVFNSDDLNILGAKQYYFQTSPKGDFPGGVICPIEDGKVIATIIEYGSKLCRRDKSFSNFLDIANMIPNGKFREIIGEAKPIGHVSTYFKKDMTLYSNSKINQKIIFLGDSLCSLNPTFGQGMTTALQMIVELEKKVKSNEFSVNSYNKICQKVIRRPFLLADLGSRKSGVLKILLDLYLRLVMKNIRIHLFFLKQLHLIKKEVIV